MNVETIYLTRYDEYTSAGRLIGDENIIRPCEWEGCSHYVVWPLVYAEKYPAKMVEDPNYRFRTICREHQSVGFNGYDFVAPGSMAWYNEMLETLTDVAVACDNCSQIAHSELSEPSHVLRLIRDVAEANRALVRHLVDVRAREVASDA